MFQVFQFWMYRFIRVILLCVGCVVSTSSLAATDLKWDLSYQTVLKDYEIPTDNVLYRWAMSNPKRAIQDRLDEYYRMSDLKIDMALLIEIPASLPNEEWKTIIFSKAKGRAGYCEYYSDRTKDHCHQLDDAPHMESAIRKVMGYGHLPLDWRVKVGDGENTISRQYDGFVSVYVDGVALQRPIAHVEMSNMPKNPDSGRMVRAMEQMLLSPEELSNKERENANSERSLFAYVGLICLVQNPAYEETPKGKMALTVPGVERTLRNMLDVKECILQHSLMPETLCAELFESTGPKTFHNLYIEYENEISKLFVASKCFN